MSKKPGPKKVFPIEKLTKLFETHEEDIILDDGKVLPSTDPFWKEFKKKYDIKATPKNLYTDAWKWNKKRVINENGKSDKSDKSDSSEFENTFENEMSINSSKSFTDESIKSAKSDKRFSIKLTSELWKLIEPVPRSYHRRANSKSKRGNRVKSVLKPGVWSSVIVEQIADHPNDIICDWSFKYARVASSGKYYV